MARRKSQEDEGASWMDTYGDMITLVLTFFVLLYSMSSIDQTKWQYIAQAFSAGKGEIINVVVEEPPNVENDPSAVYVDENQDENAEQMDLDQFYLYLKQYIQSANLTESVSVEMSKTGVYMKFKDNVFFAGDSDVLLDEGKYILEVISDGLRNVNERILSIKVSGHTAGSNTSDVNEWNLSSGRADSVINFMLEQNVCEPDKFSSAGYGKYRPVSSNDTPEGRSQNRRVEIVFIRNDIDFSDPEVLEELLSLEFGENFVGYSNDDGTVSTEAAVESGETGVSSEKNNDREYVPKSEAENMMQDTSPDVTEDQTD